MILEILRHTLTSVKTSLNLSMSYIASNDDGTIETYASRYRILRQFLTNLADRLVKVYLYGIALTCLTQCLWYQLVWFVVHLLNPDTILVDLCLDVTVGRT